MNGRNLGIVYRKELLDTLRDRRTLISSILVPLLAFPLLMIGFGALAVFLAVKMTRDTAPIMVLGEKHAPQLVRKLSKERTLEIVAPAADYAQRINDKKLRATVEIPENLEERLRANPEENVEVPVYYFEGELRSQAAVRTIEKAIREYRDELVEARLRERGLPAELLKPFVAERKNVASAEQVTGTILGLILPYFIIILSLTGALYPAIDLTAGEKERGTIETILASPVRRAELVGGKFLVVFTAALVTTGLSILSLAITVLGGAGLLQQISSKLVVAVSGKAAAAVFFLILPLAFTFSAVLLAIALAARNYREAQTYTTPLIFIVILPAMASFLPGVELNARLALVPIMNISLVAKEILAGNYPWPLIGLIFGSTCVYAVLALWFAYRQFQKEAVLFRT
jgi:sodium transport system permease protein